MRINMLYAMWYAEQGDKHSMMKYRNKYLYKGIFATSNA